MKKEQISTLKAMIEKKMRNHNRKWYDGVREYAIEMLKELDGLESVNDESLKAVSDTASLKSLLRGRVSYYVRLYSDCQIAERLTEPDILLERYDGGRLQPNKLETWGDIEASAIREGVHWIVFEYSKILEAEQAKTKKGTIEKLVMKYASEYNALSEIVALDYRKWASGDCEEGKKQRDLGSLHTVEQHLIELSVMTGAKLRWDWGEHEYGDAGPKLALAYTTVTVHWDNV